jgi:beta-glucosidase
VANTGRVAGAEVAQVYLGLPASTREPPRRLVGWRKLFLQPGTSQRVTIQVNRNDSSHPLSWWDAGSNGWRVTPGEYNVYVGNSSAREDLTLTGALRVD